MLVKHYRARFARVVCEHRWSLLLIIVCLSISTSFLPNPFSGQEVDASALHTSVSQQTIASEKPRHQTWFQIAQIEIGVGRIVRKKPTPTPTAILSQTPDKTKQYGKATQIDEHTWTMTVQNDERVGGAGEIFEALNSYRTKMGITKLIWSDTLSAYAQSRANEFSRNGTLDGHAGFMNFMNQQDGFNKVGFNALGENSSFGYVLSGTRLIEEVYSADAEHNNNQLNSGWTHVGIGVSGTATDLVFGGKKK